MRYNNLFDMRRISTLPPSAWYERELRKRTPEYWTQRGQRAALRLFHEMAERVPAYRSFLRAQHIDHRTVKTIRDFSQIPPIDKTNYLRKYSLDALSWDGKLTWPGKIISVTSGSTGVPFYFPRSEEQDEQYALYAELYLRTNFRIHERNTLYVNAFPMGAWIGGTFTYSVITKIARRGYPLSIITPGIQKREVLNAIQALGKLYDQVLIGGYGPFVKDIIDDGAREGIVWKSYRLGFIFSAEGFSEEFRDYIAEKTGLDAPVLQTLNHYGTVDLGTMSYETPITIAIRRAARADKRLFNDIFGEGRKVPTLTQYLPDLFYFEQVGDSLLCSARSGLPLVRYDLHDRGHVIEYHDMDRRLERAGFGIKKLSREYGISQTLWKLPFVQVFERKDFSVSFYAFQIYPETIRRALLKRSVSIFLTGKFTMSVTSGKDHLPTLNIIAELQKGTSSSRQLISKVVAVITNQLLEESSEYRQTFKEKGLRIAPQVVLAAYEDPRYFAPGTKQRWKAGKN